MSFDDFDPETQTKKEELKKAKQTEMLEEVDFKKYVLERFRREDSNVKS
jgi:hypothetical protein